MAARVDNASRCLLLGRCKRDMDGCACVPDPFRQALRLLDKRTNVLFHDSHVVLRASSMARLLHDLSLGARAKEYDVLVSSDGRHSESRGLVFFSAGSRWSQALLKCMQQTMGATQSIGLALDTLVARSELERAVDQFELGPRVGPMVKTTFLSLRICSLQNGFLRRAGWRSVARQSSQNEQPSSPPKFVQAALPSSVQHMIEKFSEPRPPVAQRPRSQLKRPTSTPGLMSTHKPMHKPAPNRRHKTRPVDSRAA